MLRSVSVAALAIGLAAAAPAKAETKLLRAPDLSARELVFTYAGDIWIAARDGANPRRLTSHPAEEKLPVFSADGSMVAYSGDIDGNDDVFVVPASGGQPTRLTYHPGNDRVVGFSPDGRHVYFTSPRERRAGRAGQLYRVALEGGLPEKVSEARVASGAWDDAGRVSPTFRAGWPITGSKAAARAGAAIAAAPRPACS